MIRLHEFDALRGIAAVAVVFGHVLNYQPAGSIDAYEHWSAPFWSFAANGHFAVFVFFAISGFVLSWPYFVGAKGQRNLHIDVVNRLPRLLIPVFLTGILCFALQSWAVMLTGGEQLAPFASPDWISRWNVADWDAGRVVNFLLTRVFFLYSDAETMNVNLWTMPIEFAFSFLVFAACAIFLRSYDIALALVAIAIVSMVSWRADSMEYFLKGMAGSVFFLGVFVAYYIEAIRRTVSRFIALPMMMMIAGLMLSVVLIRHDLHYLLSNALGLFSIALFFIGFASSAMLRERLKGRFFALLSEASFALYLIHGSVLYVVFQIIAAQGTYGFPQFFFGAALSLVISFALSVVIARYFEMPLVGRVRRTIGSLIRDRAPA